MCGQRLSFDSAWFRPLCLQSLSIGRGSFSVVFIEAFYCVGCYTLYHWFRAVKFVDLCCALFTLVFTFSVMYSGCVLQPL